MWCAAATSIPPKKRRDNRYVRAVARLKPNVSMAQAQAEMDTISERLAQDYVDTNGWLECSTYRTAANVSLASCEHLC